MAESKMVPQLRFKGFTDDWEQRKLGELCSEFKSGDFIRADEIAETGSYPVFGGNGLRGYTERYNHDGDFALIGRQGALCGNMNFSSGKAYFTEHAVAVKADKSNDTRFLFYCFGTMNLGQYSGQSAQPGLAVGNLVELETMVPTKAEQEFISASLTALDNLITLHQRKYDKLLALKKSMLEKMFPKAGSDVPEIRFAGFAGDWEQCKLADVLSSYTDPVEVPHTGYERLGIRSHAKGTFHSYVQAGHELQTAQMHKVAADKFIVNITFGWEHAVAVTDENDAGKLVSHRFPQFSLSDELDPKFLKFIILDENFRHHLWLASPGGAGRNRVLNLTEMLQYEIRIPSVTEQRQIAGVLIRLDNLIALHQRKYEKLKQLKQSMLEKMFV